MTDIHWLSDEDYAHAIGSLRMQALGIFDFLKVEDDKLPVKYWYGYGDYIPGAVAEIVRLAEDFGLKVRGTDKIVNLDRIRGKQWIK